jgi:hypothetical protein
VTHHSSRTQSSVQTMVGAIQRHADESGLPKRLVHARSAHAAAAYIWWRTGRANDECQPITYASVLSLLLAPCLGVDCVIVMLAGCRAHAELASGLSVTIADLAAA